MIAGYTVYSYNETCLCLCSVNIFLNTINFENEEVLVLQSVYAVQTFFSVVI